MLKRLPPFSYILIVFLFTGILLLCQAFGIKPAALPAIVLQNEPVPLTAKTFYVAGVEDERPDNNSAVALIAGDGTGLVTIPVNLQGGTLMAVRNFVRHNLNGENQLRPVIISIRQLKIAETALPNQRVDGKISVVLSFGIRRTDDTVHLIDYQGGMRYNRPAANRQVIEPSLRRSLMNALNYFNTWMDKEADGNPKLATAVKLSFSDYSNPADKDTIYYDAARPLTWDDFREKKAVSYYTADVFPGLGFNEQLDIKKGIIYIDMAMKVYLPKSDCRVKDDGRNDYVLNHEQRHFDIVKIISERYKSRFKGAVLPPENWDGELHAAYFEFMHEMNVMQESYDGETRHGQNETAQERWNQKIIAELERYGIHTRPL